VFYDNTATNNKLLYIYPSQYVNKKLYWNQSVHRDREVMANRPDVIIKKQKEERYKLIDMVTPAEKNVTQKEAEKKIQEFTCSYARNVYYVDWSQ